MKRIYIFLLILNVFSLYAQEDKEKVGVNTDTTKADFEIVGNVRVNMLPTRNDKILTYRDKEDEYKIKRDLEYPRKNSRYEPSYIIVCDDNGNLMKLRKRPVLIYTDEKITEVERKAKYSTESKSGPTDQIFVDNSEHCTINLGKYSFSWKFENYTSSVEEGLGKNNIYMGIAKNKYQRDVFVSSVSLNPEGAETFSTDAGANPSRMREIKKIENNGKKVDIS